MKTSHSNTFPRHAAVGLLGLNLLAFNIADGAPRYDYPGHFGPTSRWANSFCLTGETPGVGDFNGDGFDDVVTFLKNSDPNQTGWVYVALNDKSGSLGGTSVWNQYFSIGSEIPMTGDFNGDGRDDVITFLPNAGVFVALSNGTAFVNSSNWYPSGAFMLSGETPLVGDFNGDNRDDIAVRSGSEVWVSLSNGSAFAAQSMWTGNFQTGTPRVGDVNGDGRDDLVCFVQNTRPAPIAGDVEVALSNGTSAFTYGALRYRHSSFAPDADYDPHLADLNGDGVMDIVALHTNGAMYAAIAHPAGSFGTGNGGADTNNPFVQWHRDVRNPGEIPLFGKFNGDLNDDAAIFVRNLRIGPDNGGVLVSLCAGHALPEPDSKLADFGYNTMGPRSTTASVTQPLLLLVSVCAGNPLPSGRTLAAYDTATFGPGHPSIAGYFNEMSNGKFKFSRAGAFQLGPYPCPIPGDSFRVQLEDAANQDGPAGFEFRNFDTNSDGTISSNELVIMGISTFPGIGQAFPAVTTLFPGTARQVNINVRWAYANSSYGLDTAAHELCHAACGMVDLYGSNCRNLGLTLASCSSITTYWNHLDAWHKMRLGWVKPLIYDIRDFPAGAPIAPAQAPDARPVILYDSSRGTQDFHMLEHRNGDYSVGTRTVVTWGEIWNNAVRSGGYPRAGYDVHVRSSTGEQKGFVTWSVKTNAAHNVLDVNQRVSPGPNGLINSSILGDDLRYPATGPITQIHCGPDGILQSVATGDDSYWADALCIAVPDPDNMLSREASVIVPSGPAATTLRHYSNIAGAGDTGITVRGAAINGNNWQFLEWGKTFRPFLTNVAAPASGARPGTILAITGSLGEQRFSPEIVTNSGTRIPLNINSWTGAGGLFALPSTYVPPGNHRLLLFDGPLKEASSNAWPITVADPCQSWLTDNFNSTQIIFGLAADNADPDRDGQANLIEMIMGTNPNAPNPIPWLWSFSNPARPVISFDARSNICAVRLTLESSANLTAWAEEDAITITPEAGSPVSASRSLRGTPPPPSATRFFRRLRITRL
jgi:M6 family metalloprotease-like protein